MFQKIFKEFDADESGYMNSHELRQALNSLGKYSIVNLSIIIQNY